MTTFETILSHTYMCFYYLIFSLFFFLSLLFLSNKKRKKMIVTKVVVVQISSSRVIRWDVHSLVPRKRPFPSSVRNRLPTNTVQTNMSCHINTLLSIFCIFTFLAPTFSPNYILSSSPFSHSSILLFQEIFKFSWKIIFSFNSNPTYYIISIYLFIPQKIFLYCRIYKL